MIFYRQRVWRARIFVIIIEGQGNIMKQAFHSEWNKRLNRSVKVP